MDKLNYLLEVWPAIGNIVPHRNVKPAPSSDIILDAPSVNGIMLCTRHLETIQQAKALLDFIHHALIRVTSFGATLSAKYVPNNSIDDYIEFTLYIPYERTLAYVGMIYQFHLYSNSDDVAQVAKNSLHVGPLITTRFPYEHAGVARGEAPL